MAVRSQKVPEERTGRCEDDFVSCEFLAIFADQSDICQVLTLPQLSKLGVDIFLKILPLQAKFVWAEHFQSLGTMEVMFAGDPYLH